MKRKWNILDNSFKKAFCILLSLAIFAGVTPISAFALETEPVSVSTWQQLQKALGVGGVINLENDITADAQDTALLATAQCQLNLNGHTINRNLSSPVAGGSVIIVYDELTLSGSGTITGGYTSSYGGGVYVETNGSFVLDGATISGNRVNGANNKCGGGGVSINTKGCFRMESGEITNNTVGSANGNQGGGVRIGNGTFVMNGGAIYGNTSSGQGAGVYVLNTSVFTVSGSASVTSNTKDSKQNNIYFAGQATMTADSSLEASARFSVSSKQSNGDIINLKNPDRISCFVSDSNAYVVALSGTNKAKLVTNSFNVTVDTNISHGSVITDKSKPGAGETVTVTAIPDEGYLLDEISVTDSNGENVAVNSNTFVMPKSSVTVSATFGIAREYFLFEDSNIQNGHILIENNRVLAGQQVTVMTDGDSGRVTTSLTARYYDEWEHEYINEVADISHPDPNTITFTMPSADVNIYATFSEYNQQRVFVCDMQGGTVLLNKTAAYEGENITLTIRPDNGYVYDEGSLIVQVDLGNSTMMDIYDLVEMEKDSIYSFDMPYYTVYINATFSKAPEQPKYAVVVEDDELDNGTVETDLYEASAGWTVTVTAKPDTRLAYELESLIVIDRDGNEYDITPIGNNKYTFLMPAKDVFISAVFDIPDHQVTAQSVDVDMPNGVSTGCELNVDYPDARTGESVTAWFSLRYKTTLVDISVTVL